MVAAVLGYVVSVTLTPLQIGSSDWRVPFIIGCLIVPFLFSIRRSLEETREFAARSIARR